MRFIALALSLWVACTASTAADLLGYPEPPPQVGDYNGFVVDAVTGRPMAGVVVVASWIMVDQLPIARNMGGRSVYDVGESITNQDGSFFIPDLGKAGPPPTWQRDPGMYPEVWFYYPGYADLRLSPGTWASLRDPDSNEPLTPPELQSRYAASAGKVIALYPLGKAPPSAGLPRKAAVSARDNASSAAFRLNRLVGRSDSREQAQSTARKLSRSLGTVDAEILALTGHKYDWTTPEIVEVLSAATGQVRP